MLSVALAVFWFLLFAAFLTWAIRRRHDDDDHEPCDGSVPA